MNGFSRNIFFISWLTISSNAFIHSASSPFSTQLQESALPFAGSGPRQVNMNSYNLPLDVIGQEWTANLVAKTVDDDGGIFLGCKQNREYFVDQLQVVIPRPQNGVGLGLGLIELAGGREDGLGITVISELIEGGYVQSCIDSLGIMPGDSISSITIVRNKNTRTSTGDSIQVGLTNEEEIITAAIECLGYDATVDAILALPPADSESESMVINLRRVRRKPKVKVTLKYPPSLDEKDATLELFAGENLRLGMLVRGIKLNDPLARRFDTKSEGNCGAGGLCRTCSVSVLRGADLLNPQKPAEKQMLQDNPRWRLGCKAFVGYGMKEGEMVIQVNPNQW